MQRAAKHLACGSTQTRCTDWFSAAREMLRGALHDGLYFIVIPEQAWCKNQCKKSSRGSVTVAYRGSTKPQPFTKI